MLPLSVSKDPENPPSPASDQVVTSDEPNHASNPPIGEISLKRTKLSLFGIALAIFAHAPPKRLKRASSLPAGILDAYVVIFNLVFIYGLVLLPASCCLCLARSRHPVRVLFLVTTIVLLLCGCLGAAAIVLSYTYK